MSDIIDSEIHGQMRLKFGNLHWLNSGANMENIKIKPVFFGQSEIPFLCRAENTCLEEKNVTSNEARYDIHCSIKQFHKYLEDMSRLRIFLVDKRNNKGVGMIVIK